MPLETLLAACSPHVLALVLHDRDGCAVTSAARPLCPPAALHQRHLAALGAAFEQAGRLQQLGAPRRALHVYKHYQLLHSRHKQPSLQQQQQQQQQQVVMLTVVADGAADAGELYYLEEALQPLIDYLQQHITVY